MSTSLRGHSELLLPLECRSRSASGDAIWRPCGDRFVDNATTRCGWKPMYARASASSCTSDPRSGVPHESRWCSRPNVVEARESKMLPMLRNMAVVVVTGHCRCRI